MASTGSPSATGRHSGPATPTTPASTTGGSGGQFDDLRGWGQEVEVLSYGEDWSGLDGELFSETDLYNSSAVKHLLADDACFTFPSACYRYGPGVAGSWGRHTRRTRELWTYSWPWPRWSALAEAG